MKNFYYNKHRFSIDAQRVFFSVGIYLTLNQFHSTTSLAKSIIFAGVLCFIVIHKIFMMERIKGWNNGEALPLGNILGVDVLFPLVLERLSFQVIIPKLLQFFQLTQ